MIRNIVAVLVGLTVGMGVNMAIITLNARVLFPVPEGLNMDVPEEMNAYVATLPFAAFLVVIVAHLGQAFVGGWVAARFGESRVMALAMIVGAVSLAGGITSMVMIDGPAWLVVELPLYLVVAWWAGRLELRRRESV